MSARPAADPVEVVDLAHAFDGDRFIAVGAFADLAVAVWSDISEVARLGDLDALRAELVHARILFDAAAVTIEALA